MSFWNVRLARVDAAIDRSYRLSDLEDALDAVLRYDEELLDAEDHHALTQAREVVADLRRFR